MKTVLIIAGMHRSGTSLISSYLSSAGLDLGTNLFPPNVGNPRGLFEDIGVVTFHNQVLGDHGHKYFFKSYPGRLSWTDKHKENALRVQRKFEEQTSSSLMGWKDPRASLFLREWEEILGDQARFLLVFRNPAQVLDSLLRRGTDKSILRRRRLALLNYYVYNQRLLGFHQRSQKKTLLFEMEDVLSNPDKFVDLINEAFGLDLARGTMSKVFKPSELRVRGSSLSRSARRVLLMHPWLSFRCSRLYKQLGQYKRVLS